MQKPTPPASPAGYAPPQSLFPEADGATLGLVFRLNFLALLPLTVGILLLWLPYQLYRFNGGVWVHFAEPEWGLVWTIVIYGLIFLGSMAIHELIHAAFIRLLGHRPILNVHWGFLTAGVPLGEFLQRNHYIVIALTPLVLMTIFGGLLLPFLPVALGQPLLIALLFNFPASIGDLLVARRLFRYPGSALFASSSGGIFVYQCDLGFDKGSTS